MNLNLDMDRTAQSQSHARTSSLLPPARPPSVSRVRSCPSNTADCICGGNT